MWLNHINLILIVSSSRLKHLKRSSFLYLDGTKSIWSNNRRFKLFLLHVHVHIYKSTTHFLTLSRSIFGFTSRAPPRRPLELLVRPSGPPKKLLRAQFRCIHVSGEPGSDGHRPEVVVATSLCPLSMNRTAKKLDSMQRTRHCVWLHIVHCDVTYNGRYRYKSTANKRHSEANFENVVGNSICNSPRDRVQLVSIY